MKKIAIFASGAGSNAAKIIEYFQYNKGIRVSLIVCNKPTAGFWTSPPVAGIPVLLIEKENFFRGSAYLGELGELGIDFIVLAGFLWKIPAALVKAYPGRIINIHPALLPKYGGKGMYGHFVHEAVVQAKETHTGITIHYVDEFYDHGQIIFQEKVEVSPDDTPEAVAQKVHRLEHEHFPRIIEAVIEGAGGQPKNATGLPNHR
ncbi:phosphoribosylglycinamide formyltransferase [Puia sp. P3]|uniref:phosphoribosylglycinamide formyltransferase n=1 Tax=Puia sp. P3 TaxID=3423952 RepID=UPI003D66D5C7